MPKMQPYENYRSSGLNWLPKVPNHWEVEPLKATIQGCINGLWGDPPENGGTDLVCVRVADFDRQRFTVDTSNLTVRSVPFRLRGSRLLKPGDLLIEKSGGGEKQPVGAVVQLDEELPRPMICSNFIARMPVTDGYHSRFLTYLHATLYFSRLNTRSIKQSTGIQNLDSASYLSERVPIPPSSEQRTIADFLDRKTAEIDDLLEQKQRLTELLQEKRTALITQAVTKGLGPDVEMKHSGLKWIGKIPAHWGITQLQRLTQPDRPIMYGIVLPGPDVANGVPIVKGGDVKEDQLRISALSRTSRDIESKHTRSRLQGGDLVYAIRGSIGEVEKVPAELIGANLTQDAARVSVRDGIHSDWLLYALRSRAVFAQLEAGSLGATIRGVNIRDLKRVRLPLPPEAEQATIAGYLSQETGALTQVHREIGKAIDLLRQYRTGLISAAVTGRINVCDEARCSSRQENIEEATNNGLG